MDSPSIRPSKPLPDMFDSSALQYEKVGQAPQSRDNTFIKADGDVSDDTS